jgi:hypothetical protein
LGRKSVVILIDPEEADLDSLKEEAHLLLDEMLEKNEYVD